MEGFDEVVVSVSPEQQKRERNRATALKQSQWWRQKIGPGLCHYCGGRFSRSELTMDHILPISKGGKTTKRNVVVSCKRCNTKKKNHTLVELRFQELAREGFPEPKS